MRNRLSRRTTIILTATMVTILLLFLLSVLWFPEPNNQTPNGLSQYLITDNGVKLTYKEIYSVEKTTNCHQNQLPWNHECIRLNKSNYSYLIWVYHTNSNFSGPETYSPEYNNSKLIYLGDIKVLRPRFTTFSGEEGDPYSYIGLKFELPGQPGVLHDRIKVGETYIGIAYALTIQSDKDLVKPSLQEILAELDDITRTIDMGSNY